MANCAYCNSFILFGGKTDQTGCYCNQKCQQAGNLLALSHQLPRSEMDRLVQLAHQGACPRCNGPGPVDVHKAHKVWSAFVLTSWSSSPALSCKSCATKRQLGAILFSGVLGWWGFPWGLVVTPVQVIRNIVEMIGGPRAGRPTPLLEKYVRLQAGAHMVQLSRSPNPPLPTAPPPLPVPQDDERYKPKAA